MKKSFKFIVLAMLLCVGFVFAGCGAGQLNSQVKVDVGNEKDYVACTEQDNFMVAMESIETPDKEDGEETEEDVEPVTTVKFTLKLNVELMEQIIDPESETPTEKVMVDVMVNAMLSVDPNVEDEKNAVSFAAKATLNVGDDKEVYELYYNEGFLYVNDGDEKVKVDISEMMGEGSAPEMPEFDMEEIVSPIMEAVSNFEKQKVLKSGEKSIYQIELAENQYVYIVIDKNEIKQVKVQLADFNVSEIISMVSPQFALMMGDLTVDFELALELSESRIQFPSFDDYNVPQNEEVA